MSDPVIQIFVCRGDLEANWIADLCAQQEEEYREWQERVEREYALDDQMTLHSREPEMCSARADTDPDWPPLELDPFEEAERDQALVYD